MGNYTRFTGEISAPSGDGKCEVPDGNQKLSKTYRISTGKNSIEIGLNESKYYTVSETGQRLFEDARREIVFGYNVERYSGDDEIIEKARSCAATILTDNCPIFVAAERLDDGQQRIIHRNILVNFPGRYVTVAPLAEGI